MYHPEGEDEIDPHVHPESLRATEMGLDPVTHSGSLGTSSEKPQHFGLHIGRDHPPLLTHHSRERDREVPHAGPNVQDRVSWSHIGAENRFGAVKASSQDVIKKETAPPGTDMFVSKPKEVERVLHGSLLNRQTPAGHGSEDTLL